MNIHKNARLTVVRRRELVEAVTRGETQTNAAKRFGVSVRTVSKWLRRFREEDLQGLFDRSSRPASSPRQVTVAEAEKMLALRQAGLVGQEIAAAVGRAKTTVSKVLRSTRMSTRKDLDRETEVHRYEHDKPGSMLHLDIKKLGRFDTPGHRVLERTDGYSASGMGWEYVHVCIDYHSRVAYVEVLDQGETGDATAGFLERAVAHFKGLGVTTERVLTDNGSGYRSKLFQQAIQRLGISHSRTRPYTPRTNGKAERFIQTVQREWAYVKPYESSARRRAALPKWVSRYNEKRPHGGIGNVPPMTRLRPAA